MKVYMTLLRVLFHGGIILKAHGLFERIEILGIGRRKFVPQWTKMIRFLLLM